MSDINLDDKIALIDADTLIFYAVYNKANEVDKSLDDCKKHIDDLIKNILNYTKSTHYLLFLTVGKNFRYTIYPDYKANRKKLEKPRYFDAVKEYLVSKYKAIYHFGLEADDLCLIYNKKYLNSFICSTDKDILNLQGSLFNYKNYKWINNDKKTADLYFWGSMITGDSIDNIKGIPKKGEKFAEHIKEISEKTNTPMYTLVLKEYINHFGEYLGVQEFYKNYMCLKMKEEYDQLELVSPIKWELTITNEDINLNEQEERMAKEH